MSALFAKLWRINKIFNRKFRRVKVTEESASYIVAAFFITNLILLAVWTGVAPISYETYRVPDSADNQQYATCSLAEGKAAGWTFLGLIILVNFVSLVLACHEAFKARNISERYSEAKGLGRALFSWLQIVLVGVPVMLLLEGDNPSAKYFLQVVLVFAICLTLLCFIFVPIVMSLRQERLNPSNGKKSIRVSGINLSEMVLDTSSDEAKRSYIISKPLSNPSSDLTGRGSYTKSSVQASDYFVQSDEVSKSDRSSIPAKMPPISDSTPSEQESSFVVLPTTSTASHHAEQKHLNGSDAVDVDPEKGQLHSDSEKDGSDNNLSNTASTSHLSDRDNNNDGSNSNSSV
jgi:NADH:ubiquinone oxidoreductase subunit 6 (subunit J)